MNVCWVFDDLLVTSKTKMIITVRILSSRTRVARVHLRGYLKVWAEPRTGAGRQDRVVHVLDEEGGVLYAEFFLQRAISALDRANERDGANSAERSLGCAG